MDFKSHPAVQMAFRYGPFVEALKGESDRGCAVLALCVLEDIAKIAIERRLGAFASRMTKLLAPPGRWSMTVDSMHMLGLLSHHERLDLLQLVKARNQFAHEALSNISFDHAKVAAHIDQLHLVSWYWKHPQPNTRRERFLWTVQLLHTLISNRGGNAIALEACEEFVVAPDQDG
jgi:hypothetical protein